ncbi:MAG: hypothetical protein Q9227_009016 [Pyrenula ochraceoflavens]
MPPFQASTARGQKRKRSLKVDPEYTPPPVPQWKRAGFRSAEEANTAFWDNLPRVPLCPPALRELNRRNWLSVETANPIPRLAGPITRSTSRCAAKVNRLDQRIAVWKDRAAQLKRFTRRGGPDLHDLRGVLMTQNDYQIVLMISLQYPEPSRESPSMPPRKHPYDTPPDSSQSTSRGSGRTSAYYPGFEQNLVKYDVYPYGYRSLDGKRAPKPDNWENIQQIITQQRPSLSSSQFLDGAFEAYVDQTNRVVDEADVMARVFPILEGKHNVSSGFKRTFTSLTPLTDGTIIDAQPDVHYGAHPDQLAHCIRNNLNSYIIPSGNDRAPILPNDFTEVKGPGGTQAVVKRQACYDGALGARAMQRLQSYEQPEPVYDNNAYTITSTFDGEHLHMYTTHPTASTSPGGQPAYHMNQVNSWGMTGNVETFRQGATAYRNMRDWAKKQRDDFIGAANEGAANLPENASVEFSGYSENFCFDEHDRRPRV